MRKTVAKKKRTINEKDIKKTFKMINKKSSNSFIKWMKEVERFSAPSEDVWIVADTTSTFIYSK